MRLNRETYRDKVRACWLGKNIGGTLGTPYEGQKEILRVTDFVTPPGKPLPNDDLDLQLVWLKAMREHMGKVDEGVLGEYWIDFITPHWNEYGVGKTNMKNSLLPPLSGEYNNPWRDSNGAWIRTEIWACLCPACPEDAIKYSYADACVDHGLGEGTYAAIFVEAMESAAFVISDINILTDIALSKIPASCKVASAVRTARDCYAHNLPWEEARERVRNDSKELGWFQAPANVGYTMLGLFYGEGDFKKTLRIAVGCGDDTDCTGATAGAMLGILYGMKVIPEDWRKHIGDDIITVSLSRGDVHGERGFPNTCEELTERVCRLAEALSIERGIVFCDTQDAPDPESFMGDAFARELTARSPYSYCVPLGFGRARIEYDRQPDIAPGESLRVTVTIENAAIGQKMYTLRWLVPEGFTVEGKLALTTHRIRDRLRPDGSAEDAGTTDALARGDFIIRCDGQPQAVNRLILEILCEGRPHAGYVPVVVMG